MTLDSLRMEYLMVLVTFVSSALLQPVRLGTVLATLMLLVSMRLESRLMSSSSRFRTGTPRGLWCICLPLLIGGSAYQWESALITVVFSTALTFGLAVEKSMWLSFSMAILSLMAFDSDGQLLTRLAFLIGFVVSNVWLIRTVVESFALGECLLVTSGVAYVLTWLLGLDGDGQQWLNGVTNAENIWLIKVAFAAVLWSYATNSILSGWHRWALQLNFVSTIVVAAGMILLKIPSPIAFVQTFLAATEYRLSLVVFWLFLLSLMVPMLVGHSSWLMATTVKRKFFHLVVSLIFISGVTLDAELTLIASLLVLSLFMLIECARLYQLPPVAQLCDVVYRGFLDEKDDGPMVVSHIYLLAGTFLPLWISPDANPLRLHHLAGVISIGFGDSAAAICGKIFGRHQWPLEGGSKKTIEGSISCFVAQFIGASLLSVMLTTAEVFGVRSLLIQSCAYVTVSLLEAFTPLADNLVLPIVLQIWLKLI